MIRALFASILCCGLAFSSTAQFESIRYDYEKNWFGENQPLPAEKPWMITGTLPAGVQMVEVAIYGSKNLSKEPLYSADYRRPLDMDAREFSVPVNYNLRGNTGYTIVIRYFHRATDAEVIRLAGLVNESLEAYLDMSVTAGKNRVDLSKHPKLIKEDLDQIVQDGLSLYRNTLGIPFDGFSELVTDKLRFIEDLKLRKARFNILKSNDNDESDQTRVRYFHENMEDLKAMLKREVNQYLSYNFFVLGISREIENYKTESTRWELPINAGYAAVYHKGDIENIDDISWDGSPMVGISIPLANPYLAGKFWSNSSILAGVLLQNLDFGQDAQGEDITMTGPVVDRPLYLAYGYKTAYFLRVNLGTTITTEKGGSDKINWKPFLGLSVEFNLWLGLNR